MKNLTVLLSACLILTVAGCVTKNPNYQPPPAAQGPQNPPYVPNTSSISNSVATAHALNDATAPVNPYAPIVSPVIDGIGAVVTGASLLFAAIKNRQAAAHKSAVDTMALAISKQPPEVQSAVTTAASNSSTSDHAIITKAINDNTV